MEYFLFSCITSRMQHKRNHFGCFHLGPFFYNQAITISNILRKILLADLINLNVISVNIIGIKNEYSSIQGIRESVLDILLNLKQVVFIDKTNLSNNIYYFAYLKCKGPKIVTSNNIMLPSNIYCLDLTQYIATLSYNSRLIMKLKLSYGLNKSFFFESNTFYSNPLLSHYFNFIFESTKFSLILDANFSCVNKVNYLIDSSNNLEEYEDFVVLDIWTNGSLSPRLALEKSINIIIQIFSSFYKLSSSNIILTGSNNFLENYLLTICNKSFFLKKNFSQLSSHLNNYNISFYDNKKLLDFFITDLNFSLYTKIFLKNIGIHTIKDLISKKKQELLNNKNASESLINDIEYNLKSYKLYLRQ